MLQPRRVHVICLPQLRSLVLPEHMVPHERSPAGARESVRTQRTSAQFVRMLGLGARSSFHPAREAACRTGGCEMHEGGSAGLQSEATSHRVVLHQAKCACLAPPTKYRRTRRE